MKRNLVQYVAAPWCAAAILLAACTGGTDDTADRPVTPPPAESGAQPSVPDNPENPENPDTPDNPGKEEPKKYADVTTVLKEILGEKYNEISEEVSTNITLTAQTIDAVTDTFSVLNSVITAKAEDEESKMNEAKAKVNSYKDNSEIMTALVAQNEGRIGLTKQTEAQVPGSFGEEKGPSPIFDCNIYDISVLKDDFKVSLSGKFDYFYNHIGSLKGNIDISKLEIVSHIDRGDNVLVQTKLLKEEIYDKFNLKDKDANSLPTLNFGLYNGGYEFGLKHFLDIYDAFGKSDKLNITASFGSMDGRTLVEGIAPDDYTLFEADGDTAKSSNDKSIKSFNINELKSFADNYGISTFRNLIISGTPDKEMEVDWSLTNIIFEEDMSKLTNTSASLFGVVYFKDLPYNNTRSDGQNLFGVLKLDKLDSNVNFKINGSKESVFDIRNIDKDELNLYNPSYEQHIFTQINSVYFSADAKDLKKDDSLYIKFIKLTKAGYINNEYFGDGDRANGAFNEDHEPDPASKTLRKLSEFEYYGNYEQFETSAYSSYTQEEFNKLLDYQKDKLESDKDAKTIAKVNALYPLC